MLSLFDNAGDKLRIQITSNGVALLQRPDLDHAILSARDRVSIHVPQPLHRRSVTVERQRPMLKRSTVEDLTPFSPVAARILRESNCSAVTGWSYRIVSEMLPMRRSQMRIDLSRLPEMMWCSSNCRHVTGAV